MNNAKAIAMNSRSRKNLLHGHFLLFIVVIIVVVVVVVVLLLRLISKSTSVPSSTPPLLLSSIFNAMNAARIAKTLDNAIVARAVNISKNNTEAEILTPRQWHAVY